MFFPEVKAISKVAEALEQAKERAAKAAMNKAELDTTSPAPSAAWSRSSAFEAITNMASDIGIRSSAAADSAKTLYAVSMWDATPFVLVN